MSGRDPVVTLSPRDYDAVLFDLDGVLTRTADLHAAAWKRLFDDYLKDRSEETGAAFVEFDINRDYRRYVDGNDIGRRGLEGKPAPDTFVEPPSSSR